MIVCADDYGLADDIDRATLELADCHRITAVSCMTALPACKTQNMHALRVYADRLDLGLHLTLTDCRPLGAPTGCSSLLRRNGHFLSFRSLLRNSIMGRIDPEDVAREVGGAVCAVSASHGAPAGVYRRPFACPSVSRNSARAPSILRHPPEGSPTFTSAIPICRCLKSSPSMLPSTMHFHFDLRPATARPVDQKAGSIPTRVLQVFIIMPIPIYTPITFNVS